MPGPLKTNWRVVEITDLPLPVAEDEESVRSLRHHPGFVILTNRLKLQKAVLETELKRGSHKDLLRVHDLQAGIKWLEYLQGEVDRAVDKKKPMAEAPIATLSDTEQFERVRSLIETV